MANDNIIKIFTAADIEKYHKGQLSAKEMHDLEKAALDDPFLADALEGYATEGINMNADITELKERLAEKTAQAKVIPMHAGGRSSFPWLRVAVLIVFVAGGSLLAYQLLFNRKSGDIAQMSPKEKEQIKTADSNNTLSNKTEKIVSADTVIPGTVNNSGAETEKETTERRVVVEEATGKSNIANDSMTVNFGATTSNTPTTSVPVKLPDEKADDKKLNDLARQKAELPERKADAALKEEAKAKDVVALNKPVFKDADGVQDKFNEVVVTGYGATAKRSDNINHNTTNFFRGQVRDANNTPLPFANITSTRDNVGTYSDPQGNFTLVSPDSVLNVQVRSLGFENNNVSLRNSVAANQITLQEDRSLSATVLDTIKRNIGRARGNTLTLEEPEPEDGWRAYSSYVLNNLNIPETFDTKKTGESADNTVEVSFEVDKNGDPVNLKVEKSLCDKCDKEAMRLIKEGPKWKRKAKKGKRTTVSVPFIKTD